jgi:diadenosine tetraphosphatase ApaH/serine/threonine PP2A family protein phosphatase
LNSNGALNFRWTIQNGRSRVTFVKRLVATLVVLVLLPAIWLKKYGAQPAEPVWHGHYLSQWLNAYNTNLRFPDETPPRSGFSDAEIEEALNGIGDRALFFLIKWLPIETDNGWRWTVDAWLFRTGLLRFFHDVPEAMDWQGRAINGFMFYGIHALPLLTEVDKLTHSNNADLRMVAYEAAFFSHPPKKLFLPIADRALKENDPKDQAMAAQCMIERFINEADKRALNSRYPQFIVNPIETNPVN